MQLMNFQDSHPTHLFSTAYVIVISIIFYDKTKHFFVLPDFTFIERYFLLEQHNYFEI